MNKKDLRIVFMGTPDFAVESLRALADNDYNIVGVITMPDKPKGKHHSELWRSPIKEYALSENLPLLQPENLKDPDFLNQLNSLNADIQIVVAFRMLPEVVWNMPRLGTFNLHASLLPQYRGAAPINWAIINGEKETGVTTFFLTHEIDTGKIIEQVKTEITEADNAETVHNRLMHLGAELVTQTVDNILNDSVQPTEQNKLISDIKDLKSAPKIFKETCKIDWNQNTEKVYNFIRGLSPYPAAWTELTTEKGTTLNMKVFQAEKSYEAHHLPVGTMVSDGKNFIKVGTNNGFIYLKSIQQAGKKQMSVEDFLRGNKHLF
ncbi:MAG: methionyl-tRNA formyltransferase [Dysgonamonadaceae bacterium]|jgi:methionyl-tRNA formyltransferase|nr:methionyl-tRNA formyltransferase [Dysgonamonadaceae bacterium]